MEALDDFLDKRKQLAIKWAVRIQKMIDSSQFDYAIDYLESVAKYIENNNQVTEKQIQALKNIEDHPANIYGD